MCIVVTGSCTSTQWPWNRFRHNRHRPNIWTPASSHFYQHVGISITPTRRACVCVCVTFFPKMHPSVPSRSQTATKWRQDSVGPKMRKPSTTGVDIKWNPNRILLLILKSCVPIQGLDHSKGKFVNQLWCDNVIPSYRLLQMQPTNVLFISLVAKVVPIISQDLSD